MIDRLGPVAVALLLVTGVPGFGTLAESVEAQTSGADLVPVSLLVRPSEPQEGDEVSFYANVTNDGNETASSFTIALDIHDEESSAWERLRNVSVGNLSPGEHVTVAYEDMRLPDGNYSIEAIADVHDEVNETDEKNNVERQVFTVEEAEGQPNLVADVGLRSNHVAVGETLDVWYSLSNQGDTDAGSFEAEVRVDGETVNQQHFDGLAAHSGLGWSDEIGPFEEGGFHTVTFVVDTLDEVDETDERDNQDSERFEVIVLPDPAVTAVDVSKERLRTDPATGPANPIAGQTVAVTVDNVGEGEMQSYAQLTIEACPDDAIVFSPIQPARCERIEETYLDDDEIERGTTVEADWDTFGKAGDWTICATLDTHAHQTDHTNDERCQDTFIAIGGTGLGGIDARP